MANPSRQNAESSQHDLAGYLGLRRNSESTRESMALAGYLGARLNQTLSRISQQEVDIFFREYDSQDSTERKTQEIAAEEVKQEQEEGVEKPQKSTSDHQNLKAAVADAGKVQAEKEGRNGTSGREEKFGKFESSKFKRLPRNP